MSASYTFNVMGDPKGQPRPRAFAMKLGNGKFSARVFDAGTAEGWKSLVAAAAVRTKPDQPFDGPVSVRIGLTFRRPKAHYRANGYPKPSAPKLHIAKPDCDNLAKAILDAITQLGGFWRDDSQVAHLEVWKSYGPLPGATIRIEAAT